MFRRRLPDIAVKTEEAEDLRELAYENLEQCREELADIRQFKQPPLTEVVLKNVAAFWYRMRVDLKKKGEISSRLKQAVRSFEDELSSPVEKENWTRLVYIPLSERNLEEGIVLETLAGTTWKVNISGETIPEDYTSSEVRIFEEGDHFGVTEIERGETFHKTETFQETDVSEPWSADTGSSVASGGSSGLILIVAAIGIFYVMSQ